MKKLSTLILLASLWLLGACSTDNDSVYLSASGEGSLVVENNSPDYLYRMVFFNSSSGGELYLLGYSAYVDAEGIFGGRGAVVKLELPANVETLSESLQAQSFDVGDTGYSVSYSTYVNFSNSEGSYDYISLSTGTVIIRRSGSYYDIRLLGVDTDGQNVIGLYRGYIYRWFYDEVLEEETRG